MKLKLRKGLNLSIKGFVDASAKPVKAAAPALCAIVPDDYPGFVPKVAVKEGDTVSPGQPLLFDKNHPDVKLVSPVSGTVRSVVRGERRKILRVEVVPSAENLPQTTFAKAVDSKSARSLLAQSGLLALMRQRPYDIVPNPDEAVVRDIFVTALDTAPLAFPIAEMASMMFDKADLEAGVALLSKITDGKVYLSHGEDWKFGAIAGAEDVTVEGPHPSGNVGVQIANIKPVDKGDIVWTLDVITLGRIGRLAAKDELDFRAIVAVTGPEVKSPKLIETVVGAPVESLIKGNIVEDGLNHRVISGNVFTGVAVDAADGSLRYPYRQITVIAEGDDVDEFMGWASLSPRKMSESRTFPGHFFKKLFAPDARLLGGRRAMIMSGQYDSVMPMDILPEYLIKAILSHNIEDMEKLGIYEVAPEDFAAAEYADTSKLPLQQIVRDGLDYLRKELE